jgi:hypothetical protein
MNNAPTINSDDRGIATQQRNSTTLEHPLQHFAPTLWVCTAFTLIALTGAQNGHNAPVLGGVGVQS